MKSLFLQQSKYNAWANERLMQCCLNLSEEKLITEIPSSFPNIRLTMLHMWNAEAVWWQRVKLVESVYLPMDDFKGTVIELSTHWKVQSKEWVSWLETATEAMIHHEFIYHNSKKERFKQPVADALEHLFLHQSYHRGQLVTMLRQLGIKEIPATDYIVFTRKK